MPSHKPVRTYEKKTRLQLSSSSKSVDAINALFAQNLTKRLRSRRKAKLKIKELPPRTETYLTDESLNTDPNNTFDKLLKGKVYNKVKVGNVGKIHSSESETSRSKAQISVSFHSPIMTRRRKKTTVVITEISDNPKETARNNSSTLDKPVTSNLSVEKENKAVSISSLSYIKLPKITENEVMNNNEESFGPIFSETFRERQAVHSSTPCVTAPIKKIVIDPISPITKSDSSNSSQLIEKSYDQIRKWDEIFPNLEETPQKKKSTKDREDWKLYCQPIVCLKSSDMIGSRKTRLKRGDCDFRGFSEEEQLSSSKESCHFQNWLSNVSVSYEGHSCEKTLPELKLDPSLKTPIKKRERVSKRSIHRRKSKRLQNNSQGREKLASPRVSRKSKIFRISNKRSLKEKLSLDSHKKVKTKLKDEKPPPNRSARTLQKVQSNKFSLTPLKRSTKTLQPTRKKKNSVTPPKRFRKTLQFDENDADDPSSQRFITLRRREIACSAKTSKKMEDTSSGRKLRTRKSLCINVTEDILSEKEVSYSNSSFDFSSESSRSKISYTTEELQQEREISLPKINSENKLMTVDMEDFDNFMESYIEENKNEPICVPREVPALSIITLSDDSMFNDSIVQSKVVQVRPSAIKEEKVSSSETSIRKDIIENSCLQNEVENLDFSVTPRKSNIFLTKPKTTPPNSKIVILSDISLGFSKAFVDKNESLKNIQHDHSYSSPDPKMKQTPLTIAKVEEVQTSPWIKQRSGLSDIIESSFLPDDDTFDGKNLFKNKITDRKFRQKSIKLKPGKSYRRSLSLLKRSSVVLDIQGSILCDNDCICMKCLFRSKFNPDVRRASQIVPASRDSISKSILESYARSYVRGGEEEDRFDNLDESVRNLSLDERRKSILQHQQLSIPVTAKEVVLRRCGQTEVLPFEECYPRSVLQNCQKIGEGVYGEVFLYRNQNGGTSVMKVIPIEGDLSVNGERQKKFDEILSEIVIAMELSNLRNNKKNTTSCFTEVQKVRCTKGNYPDRLIDLWDLYDETKGSENDSPQMFPSNQTYIVLELANGGRDLESFVFNNAMQAYAMFKQTACALAVAENQLKFEHRDLHWGNILISGVDKDKRLKFRLDGKEIEVETFGVEVAIIDFTLSRIEFEGVVIFNDLSLDNELFVAEGDYQFEVYRAMQKSNGNEWQHFEPYTNILWLHYLLDKAVASALRYKNPRTKIHKEYLSKMKKIKDEILSYNSVVEFVTDNFV